jgi:hypothetical protein
MRPLALLRKESRLKIQMVAFYSVSTTSKSLIFILWGWEGGVVKGNNNYFMT